MKIIKLLILAFLIPTASQAALYPSKIEIAYSGFEYCARIDDSATELLCWGNPETTGIRMPLFSNLTSFSVAMNRACAVDGGKLKCWGSSSAEVLAKFSQINPLEISIGLNHACALDANSVTCEGYWFREKPVLKNLVNPRMLTSYPNAVCVIDDSGLHCRGTWGTPYNEGGSQLYGDIPVPELKNPTFVSMSFDRICAIDEEGLKCWDYNQACKRDSDWGQPDRTVCIGATGRGMPKGGEKWTVEPSITSPTKVTVFEHQTCVLDQGKLKCWTCGQQTSQLAPYRWQNCGMDSSRPLVELSDGGHFQFGSLYYDFKENPVCRVGDDGVECPAVKVKNAVEMPEKLKNFRPYLNDLSFPLSRAGKFTGVLAANSSLIKSRLLAQLESFFNTQLSSRERSIELNLSRYLFLKLSEKVFLSGDSAFYLEKVIPAYVRSIGEIEAELSVQGLQNIPASTLNRRVALKTIQAILSVAVEVLPIADRAALVDVLRILGQAMENPLGPEKIQPVLAGLAAKQSIIDKLKASPKTAFIPLVLLDVTQWLEQAK